MTRTTAFESDRRRWLWVGLIALSAALHLWALGDRSFHHDESVHAKLSYDLATRGMYRYDPTYHGPLLYFLTAGGYLALGDGDTTARLPIALAGIALLWVAWRSRRIFGEVVALWCALLATISPLFLYYGRFLRMDVLEVLTATCALLALHACLRGGLDSWAWLGVWTGLAFATKENAFVTVALLGGVGAILALKDGLRSTIPSILRWLADRWAGVALAAALFLLVTVPLFTAGFSHPEDWLFPSRAVSYWWSQHAVQRVAGPWWYHLPRLLQYEFLILAAATVWVVRNGRRLRRVEASLYILGLLSVAIYAYLGEKVPWLGVHQVWPFIPLAASELAHTMGSRGRWAGRLVAGAGLVVTVAVSLVASFVLQEITPARRRVESLHYVQTCPELRDLVSELRRLESGDGDSRTAVLGEATWPLAWYLRHDSTAFGSLRPGALPQLVVCDPEQVAEIRAGLAGAYSAEHIPLRAWWLMERKAPTLGQVLRYGTTRVPWGFIGSSEIVVLRRAMGSAAREQGPRGEPSLPRDELSGRLLEGEDDG